MGQIVPANQFNPAATSAPDLYILIVNPPSYIRGIPTDVIGVVGTGSWGPVNTAVHGGSATDFASVFGPISAASLTDPYDMATDLAIAFGQQTGQGSTIEGFAVRVTDGTDVAASGTLAGAATVAASIATITGSATNNDVITLTATSSALTGSPISINYTVKTSDTVTIMAAALVAGINGNAVLAAAGVVASNLAGVITIYSPAALSPAIVWSRTSGSTETITITTGSTTTAGATATSIYTGVLGNQVVVSYVAGSQTGGITVSVTPPAGIAEVYPNIPVGNFWTALQGALANGLSGVRGPSQIIRLTSPNNAVGSPTAGTSVTLAGGTDGRAGVTVATLLGSDTAVPKTGLYALRNQNPAVGVVWLVGTTSSTAWAALLAFGQTSGAAVLAPFATGTSTAVAVAAVATNGIHDPCFTYLKDWIYFFDSINNVTRLVAPTAFVGGTWAGLSPQFSPLNNSVNLVQGTDRWPPGQPPVPYSDAEIGQLANAGINLITNPIPAGTQWGIRNGMSTSLNAGTLPMEYWRLTSFIARSLNSSMGTFIGQNQSAKPNDPLRQAISAQLNAFMTQLVGDNIVDSYVALCGFSAAANASPGLGINTPTSIAQHFVYAIVQAKYLASVWYFILSLQGGTTVVTVVGAQTA